VLADDPFEAQVACVREHQKAVVVFQVLVELMPRVASGREAKP
jgi:hypothetical protein